MQQSAGSAAQGSAASPPGGCACPSLYAPVCCGGHVFMSACSAACFGGVTDLGGCVAGTGPCPLRSLLPTEEAAGGAAGGGDAPAAEKLQQRK